MKKLSVIVALFLVLFLGQSQAQAKDAKAEEVATAFVQTTMQDFASKDGYREELISPKAKGLRQHLEDRRRVMEKKRQVSVREMVGNGFNLKKIESKEIDGQMIEVLMSVELPYLDGGAQSYLYADYKVVLDKADYKVLAAFGSDISGEWTYTDSRIIRESLPYEQIENSEFFYNIDEVLASIQPFKEAYVDELAKEKPPYKIEMTLNGAPVYAYEDALLAWDRIYLEVQEMADIFDLLITIEQPEKLVSIESEGANIQFKASSYQATVNGKEVQVDQRKYVIPFAKEEKIYVPLRFIAEALDMKVDYKLGEGKHIVAISKEGLKPVAYVSKVSPNQEGIKLGDVLELEKVQDKKALVRVLDPNKKAKDLDPIWISLENIEVGIPIQKLAREVGTIYIEDPAFSYDGFHGKKVGRIDPGYYRIVDRKEYWNKVEVGDQELWLDDKTGDYDFKPYFQVEK